MSLAPWQKITANKKGVSRVQASKAPDYAKQTRKTQ